MQFDLFNFSPLFQFDSKFNAAPSNPFAPTNSGSDGGGNAGPAQDADYDFKPVHVIDYEDRKVSDENSLLRRPQASSQHSKPIVQFDENIPRRVYEYDHKTMKTPFKWFSPVQYFEYCHTSQRVSLHEEPTPKPIELEPLKPEYMPHVRPGFGPRARHISPWPARPPFRPERSQPYQRVEPPYHPRPDFYPGPSGYRPRAEYRPPGHPPRDEFHAGGGGAYPPRAEAPGSYYRNPYDKGNLIHNSRYPAPNLR